MEWTEVEFSTNLVKSAFLHLCFLDKVDNLEKVLRGKALQHALMRYEQLWLPLANEQSSIEMVPPIDVHWLWYIHMLQPLAYRRDCRKLLKTTLDHYFQEESRHIPCTNNAIEVWYAAYPKEGYNIIRNGEYVQPRRNKGQINTEKPSKLSVDLVSLAETHMHFCYQVALPHFRDKKYLENAERRYKQFLCLKRIEPEEFLTPSVDILLMWYTHMCNPVAYANDLMKICGKVLDNTVKIKPALINDRFIVAREKTDELWRRISGEELVQPGTKLRSSECRKEIFPVTEEDLKECCVIVYRLYLAHDDLQNFPHKNTKLNLKIYRLNRQDSNWEEMVFLEGLKRIWAFSSSFLYNTVQHKELMVVLSYTSKLRCLRGEHVVGSAPVDIKSHLEKMTPTERALSLDIDLTSEDDADGYKLHIDGAVDQAIPMLCDLTLQKESFMSQKLTTKELQRTWGHTGCPDTYKKNEHSCFSATHRLTNHENEESFRCRIMHIPELLHSGVEIFLKQKLVTTAHLIGSSQLPSPSQVSIQDMTMAFDPELGERAMLIRNHSGDWGLCIARWIKDKESTGLDVRFMKLTGKSAIQNVYIDTADVEFQSFNANLYSGKVIVNPTKNTVAENLATFWSICVLYALCSPPNTNRQIMLTPVVNVQVEKPDTDDVDSDEEKKTPVYVQERSCQFLLAAGLGTEIPSNSYVLSKYGSLTYDLKMDAQDIIVEEYKTPRRLLKKESVISVASEDSETPRRKKKKRSSRMKVPEEVDESSVKTTKTDRMEELSKPHNIGTQQSVSSDVDDAAKPVKLRKIRKRKTSNLEDMLAMSDDSITKDEVTETKLVKDEKGRRVVIKKISSNLNEEIAPSDDSLDEEIKEKEEFLKVLDDEVENTRKTEDETLTTAENRELDDNRMLVPKESLEYNKERTILIREVAEKRKRVASENAHILPGTVTSSEAEENADADKVVFHVGE